MSIALVAYATGLLPRQRPRQPALRRGLPHPVPTLPNNEAYKGHEVCPLTLLDATELESLDVSGNSILEGTVPARACDNPKLVIAVGCLVDIHRCWRDVNVANVETTILVIRI